VYAIPPSQHFPSITGGSETTNGERRERRGEERSGEMREREARG
jgi:hypothetical protein